MSKISIAIEYAGLQLQIGKNEQGQDVTPLKPIADLFGLEWKRQHKKVTESDYLNRFMGVCIVPMYHAGGQKREQTCILLSRVAAFLMSINPEQVRAQGNETGADYLEEKLHEWADALHDYEEIGAAINMNHARSLEALRKQRVSFAQMINIKNKTEELCDRRALGHVVKKMAEEIGIPYQSDLLEEQSGT
jgi:P22_AR N-terminal domain